MAARQSAPELLVSSGDLDGIDELEVVRGLGLDDLDFPVILVSARDDADHVTAAARAGVRGYLLATTTAPALRSCCHSVAQGGTFFDPVVAGHLVDALRDPPPEAKAGLDARTERELEILSLVARGGTTRSIAAELVLSIHSVRRHVEHIFAKLGVSSRAAAVSAAMAAGADLRLDGG